MARLSIRWSRNAFRQIRNIGDYIAADSPVQAKRVVEKLFAAPEKVSSNPRRGQIVPELASDEVREIRVYSYRIIYRYSETIVEVAAVLHGKQLLTPERLGPE